MPKKQPPAAEPLPPWYSHTGIKLVILGTLVLRPIFLSLSDKSLSEMTDYVFPLEQNWTAAVAPKHNSTNDTRSSHHPWRHQKSPDFPTTPPTTPRSPDNFVPRLDYDYDFLHYDDFEQRFPPLPDWMEDVLAQQPTNDPQHHHDMLTNPANKFIVLTCYVHSNSFLQQMGLEDCGGLADRLLLLPLQLWMAHKSERKLLIKYYKPWPLDEFLVPPPPAQRGFDWRLPEGYLMEDWYRYGNRTKDQYAKDRWHHWELHFLKEPYASQRVLFMNSNLLAIPMLKNNRMDQIINASCETMWPTLFRRLFQPSPATAQAIQAVTQPSSSSSSSSLSSSSATPLQPGTYGAMHIRARWPDKRFKFAYKGAKWWRADKFGGAIDMQDPPTFRSVAALADHAIACTVRIMTSLTTTTTKENAKANDQNQLTIYVASDASEVIEYLKQDSPYWSDNKLSQDMNDTASSPIVWRPGSNKHTNTTPDGIPSIYSQYDYDVPAWQIDTHTTKLQILARSDYHLEPPHFDRNRWPAPNYALFVDLWIMAHASCHAQGVGGFGRFGSVLSGQRRVCATRHRDYTGIVQSCATPAERKVWRAKHPEIESESWAITDKK